MSFVSGSTRRAGVAEEVGVAGRIANEEIEIAIAIDIGSGRAGVPANIRDSKGFVSFLLFEGGTICRTGVAEEEGVAVSIANKEV